MNWKLQKNPSICSRGHLSYIAQKGVWAVFKEGETGSSSQGVSLFLLHNTKGLCLTLTYSSGSCGLKKRRVEGVGLLFILLFNELETPGRVSPGKTALAVQFHAGEAVLPLGSAAIREDPAQSAWALLLKSRDTGAGMASSHQPGPIQTACTAVRATAPLCVCIWGWGGGAHTAVRGAHVGGLGLESICEKQMWCVFQSVTAGAWERSLSNDCVKIF